MGVSQPLPAGVGIGLGHCRKLQREVGIGGTFLNELVFQMLFLFFFSDSFSIVIYYKIVNV